MRMRSACPISSSASIPSPGRPATKRSAPPPYSENWRKRARPSPSGTRIGHERPLENEPMNRTWLNPVAYDRYSFIKVEVDDNGVGTVTMNEPDKLNAIGPEQHREIEDIWLDLARDESIRTIVRSEEHTSELQSLMRT